MFLVLASFRYFHLHRYKSPIVVFFNTAEGDAIMLRNSDFCTILIDGGNDYALIDSLYRYLPFNKRSIDYAYLSHPHLDHLHGLYLLSQRFSIKEFTYASSPPLDSRIQAKLDDLIFSSQSVDLVQSNTLELNQCGFQIKAYKADKASLSQDINTHSLVMEVYLHDKWVLLSAGDIYSQQEQNILAKLPKQDLYLFKSNHHGSKTSNSLSFMQSIQPKLTVVTSGYANRFHHPDFHSLNRMRKHSQNLLRTDVEGEVIVELDSVFLSH